MAQPFYGANTWEEAVEVYLQSENEPYAQAKNRVLMEVLGAAWPQDRWNSLEVLEIGAGGGFWTEVFVRQGADVTSIDLCQPILARNQHRHPEAKFVAADATTLKMRKDYDLIFAKDVIEHIRDDQAFLRNMRQHLKQTGLLVINTQNSWSLNCAVQATYHRLLRGDRSWCGWDPGHVRFYSKSSLHRKLKAAGFRAEKWFGAYYFPSRVFRDRMRLLLFDRKEFFWIESVGLNHVYPFSLLGWNLGVVAGKDRCASQG